MYKLMGIFGMFLLSACYNKTDKKEFVGKIYIDESFNAFFQFVSKDSAVFYSVNEHNREEIHKRKASWKKINDSTIELLVFYQPDYDDEKFVLIYHKKGDYFKDEEGLSSYRRTKGIRDENFNLEEF